MCTTALAMLAAAAAAAAVSATQHPATLDRILQNEAGGAQDFLPRRVWQPDPCAPQTNCTVDSSFARHLAATWASSEDHTIISRAVDADPSRLCLCPPVPNASLINESLPQQAGGTSSSMTAGDGRAPFFMHFHKSAGTEFCEAAKAALPNGTFGKENCNTDELFGSSWPQPSENGSSWPRPSTRWRR